jgi:cell division septation protein DedD
VLEVPTPSPDVRGWHVQLGVFSSRDNAERLVENVSRSGFSASLGELPGAKPLYRVRVGAATRAAAEAMAEQLAAAGYTGQVGR